MPKLERKNQKIFGAAIPDSVENTGISQFGSLAANNVTYTKDPETIQALPGYSLGWLGATVRNNVAPLQDMNALQYLFSYQLAYLFQSGVPEWKNDQDYYKDSFCRAGGTLYVSTQDNNTGKPVTDTNYWRPYALMSVGPSSTCPLAPPVGHLHYDTSISRWVCYRGLLVPPTPGDTGWTTVEGAPGDIKYVSAPTLQEALARNPGWAQFTTATGRVLAGADPGNSAKSNGSTIGSEAVELTTVQMPPHTHNYKDVGFLESHPTGTNTEPSEYGGIGSGRTDWDNGRQVFRNTITSPAGGGQPVSLMQPTVYAWCLIKF